MKPLDARTRLAICEQIANILEMALEKHIKPDYAGDAFWIMPIDDRIIVSIDPMSIKNIDRVLSSNFRHFVGTASHGRKVVSTNTRGIFYQISYFPLPIVKLESRELNLDEQPSPLHVPIGNTKNGPLWLSVVDLDAVLIGGSRGMGKSNLLHSWIQSLLVDASVIDVYLWDGKEGAEFMRYKNLGAHVEIDLNMLLLQLVSEVDNRRKKITTSGYSSMIEYNIKNEPIKPIVLIIDEAAFVPSDCNETLNDLVARGRAWGIHVVMATQRTGVTEISPLIKANMTTRISFRVPDLAASRVILGRTGAEKLPQTKGLLLFERNGKMVRAQAFLADKPSLQENKPDYKIMQIFRKAIDETGGKLSIPVLSTMEGWTSHLARKAIDEWEALGWLTRGQDNARFVAERIRELISQTTQTDQTAQADSLAAQTET